MVFNQLLKLFNLEIVKDKLFYHHNLYYGSVDFLVADLSTTEGMNKLISFLDIPYMPTTNEVEDVYYAVTNSQYFTKKVFTKLIYPDVRYKEFVETIQEKKPLSIYRNVYFPGRAAMIVDKHFGTDISRRTKEFQRNSISRRKLRSKFNGHLIQKWVPELKAGTIITDLKEDFKNFIEDTFRMNFVEYLLDRDTYLIRKDFINYYYGSLNQFDRMFLEDDIPF